MTANHNVRSRRVCEATVLPVCIRNPPGAVFSLLRELQEFRFLQGEEDVMIYMMQKMSAVLTGAVSGGFYLIGP